MTHAVQITQLLADIVWPALVLEKRMLGVLPITVGLIVEWLALWLCGFGLTWKKAAVVDVVMNTVSSLIGVFLIPVLGMVWELGPVQLINRFAEVGTFSQFNWIATFVIALLATTAVEATVVRWGFWIALGMRRLGVLLGANFLSVGFAFASVILSRPSF